MEAGPGCVLFMEFIMKSKETLAKIRESLQYRQMFREIIKTQIQTLIDQLAYTGEESVLLTACTSEDDVLDNVTIGSVLGLEFLKQYGVLCTFREFCSRTPMNIDEKLAPSEDNRSSSDSAYPLGKRKFSQVNGEDKEENSETEHSASILDTKRPRSLTPLLNVSGKDESSTVESNNSGRGCVLFMEFMMKSKETLTKIRESLQYRQMFREIIKTQIQTLIDQLAYTGEESVLLTACTSEDDVLDNVTVGSVLGLEFLKQYGVFCTFREFCAKTPMNIDEKLVAPEVTRPSSDSAFPLGKRKFSEVNGEDKEESSETENSSSMDTKRPRSLTPLLNVQGKDESSTVESNNSATFVPKGYSKCSVCNYMSKFKANVTRHERAVHRINLEGAPLVTVQYACAICDYKSTYRSNVMRHEKSIHKLSTAGELDIEDDSFIQRIPNEGAQSVISEGNQLFLNQTGIHTDNVENQSYVSPYTDYNELNAQIRKEPVQFDTEAGDQSYQTGDGTKNDCNKSYIQSAADDVSELEEDGEGCHICNHCHEIFKSLSELRNHIDTTHFTVGNFICEKCEQSFKTEFRLQIHMATHNASKQEVCGCGKAFQYRTSLIRHERKCEYLKASQGSSKQGSECVDSNIESSFHLKENTYTQNLGPVDTDKMT